MQLVGRRNADDGSSAGKREMSALVVGCLEKKKEASEETESRGFHHINGLCLSFGILSDDYNITLH